MAEYGVNIKPGFTAIQKDQLLLNMFSLLPLTWRASIPPFERRSKVAWRGIAYLICYFRYRQFTFHKQLTRLLQAKLLNVVVRAFAE
jgi:hypothetical protein